LDTALQRADSEAQAPFQILLAGAIRAAAGKESPIILWDFETWADGLDRAPSAYKLASA
jgi:hypothetical protein